MDHLQAACMQHHGVTGALQLPALQAFPLLCGEAEGQHLRRVPGAVAAPCDTAPSCASSEWRCWFGSGEVTEKECSSCLGVVFLSNPTHKSLILCTNPFLRFVAVCVSFLCSFPSYTSLLLAELGSPAPSDVLVLF